MNFRLLQYEFLEGLLVDLGYNRICTCLMTVWLISRLYDPTSSLVPFHLESFQLIF